MNLIISPYHMTSQEPAAIVGVLLARSIVAPMPTPAGALTRESVTLAATRVPGYVDLMESWEWARPLFAGGLCATAHLGEDPFDEVPGVCASIEQDDQYASLRPFMRTILEQDSDSVIGAISRDVIKAGPDPSISVPLAAAIDRFASYHKLVSLRSDSKSEAQRAEERLARPILRFAFESLTQAPPTRLLEYRSTFEPQLEALRGAIDAEDEALARSAAEALTRAFEREREDITRIDDPDDVRVIAGMVSVSLIELPEDAVLISSAAAARRTLGHSREQGGFTSPGRVRSIVVRPIGGRPPRR